MADLLDYLGLGALDGDIRKEWLKNAMENGRTIVGYYGLPYKNINYGLPQIIVRTRREEDGRLAISGYDTHSAGWSVWTLRIEKDLAKDGDPLSKRLLLKGWDEGAVFAADVVNADVLPSFSKDELIRLQVIAYAYARDIRFYQTESEYRSAVKPGTEGEERPADMDTVSPIGPDGDFVRVHGTIKKVFWGKVRKEVKGEVIKHFAIIRVTTQFGDLEIATDEEIRKENGERMRAGCVADCRARLCGDAGIYELERGISPDPESNLKLMRYTLEGGDPERLRSVLADSFEFRSEVTGRRIGGAGAFIDFLRTDGNRRPGRASYAALERGGAWQSDRVRCLLLKDGGEDTLVLVDTNAEGKIVRVLHRKDGGFWSAERPAPVLFVVSD